MLGAAGIWKHQAIYDQLYEWKLIPRPERLTELYFADHRNLPQNYHPGKEQTVAFTVRNLEYRNTAYTYTVTQKNTDGKAKQLAKGTFSLQHDTQKTIDAAVSLADLGKRAKVMVTISYDGIAFAEDAPSAQQQSIYYWTAKGKRSE